MADISREPVAVIGLGRFGSAVALELTHRGTEVLAIDQSGREVQDLAGELTQSVTADCTDIEALRQLGVGEFYRAVVAIGDDLEASILITSLLVELGVDDIWAKATSSHHGRILERIGAHHVVFPEQDMGERVAHMVTGRMLDYMQVDDDFAIAKIRPPREIVGVSLGESKFRAKYGITIVAVKRDGETFGYASHETVLTHDDLILAVGLNKDIDRLVNSD